MVTRKRKFTALPVPFSFGHHFIIIREACHSKESKRTGNLQVSGIAHGGREEGKQGTVNDESLHREASTAAGKVEKCISSSQNTKSISPGAFLQGDFFPKRPKHCEDCGAKGVVGQFLIHIVLFLSLIAQGSNHSHNTPLTAKWLKRRSHQPALLSACNRIQRVPREIRTKDHNFWETKGSGRRAPLQGGRGGPGIQNLSKDSDPSKGGKHKVGFSHADEKKKKKTTADGREAESYKQSAVNLQSVTLKVICKFKTLRTPVGGLQLNLPMEG